MILMPDNLKVFFYVEPTDMRKSIDTLALLVSDVLSLEPASGHLFLFRNRKGDKLKALHYEQNCFTLWYRRLEKGKYIIPKDVSGHIEMTAEHFSWLLASDKFSRMEAMATENYCNYY